MSNRRQFIKNLTVATHTCSVLSPEIVPSILNPEEFFYESISDLEKVNPKAEEIKKEIRAQVGKARASGLHFVYLGWPRSGDEKSWVQQLRKEITMNICKEQKLIFGQDYGPMYGYKAIPFILKHWPTQVLHDGQRVYYPAPALSETDRKMFFDNLNNLKPGKWISVIHPGLGEPERASIVELLCLPETKNIIRKRNIQLMSYYDLWQEEFGKKN